MISVCLYIDIYCSVHEDAVEIYQNWFKFFILELICFVKDNQYLQTAYELIIIKNGPWLVLIYVIFYSVVGLSQPKLKLWNVQGSSSIVLITTELFAKSFFFPFCLVVRNIEWVGIQLKM